MDLQGFFGENPQVAVAFSGGVDSAYLLYAAKRWAQRVKAYYVSSQFQPQFELDDAQRLAQELGAELEVLEIDILCQPKVVQNPPDRCYYCKKAIFSQILEAARADGFPVLLDGTNASDDGADRPGMRVLGELQVRSPLRECGLTKAQVREASRLAGLFTWDKPAYACLATRIPTGQPITAADLRRTEQAENALSALGLQDLRVRLQGNAGKLQVRAQDLPWVQENWTQVLACLKPYYESVSLDLEVRR